MCESAHIINPPPLSTFELHGGNSRQRADDKPDPLQEPGAIFSFVVGCASGGERVDVEE
jgi:hypothetical protein